MERFDISFYIAVPGKVSEEEFWTRYLFHKHNIEDEEKKRQELLQGELYPELMKKLVSQDIIS